MGGLVEEVDLAGHHLELGALALGGQALVGEPLLVLQAATTATGALGHVLGDGLGLGSEGDHVDEVGRLVLPVARAAGDGKADGACGGAAGREADLGVSGQAADELEVFMGWFLRVGDLRYGGRVARPPGGVGQGQPDRAGGAPQERSDEDTQPP